MPKEAFLTPSPLAQVLTPAGKFTSSWYLFFQELARDISQIGDCVVQAVGPVNVNWLACDGSAVSRSTYAELFKVIGTTYGAGDGVTTFNLPNFASPGAPAFWKIHYQ